MTLPNDAEYATPETLLLSVIATAVDDWRWLEQQQIGWTRRDDCNVSRLELECFFSSKDFDVMCVAAGLEPDFVRRAA